MTPEDVFRMSDKYANNPTMRRLIADHAGKMADDTKFEGSRASLLRFPPNWHMKKIILSKVGMNLWQQRVVTQDTKEPTTDQTLLFV